MQIFAPVGALVGALEVVDEEVVKTDELVDEVVGSTLEVEDEVVGSTLLVDEVVGSTLLVDEVVGSRLLVEEVVWTAEDEVVTTDELVDRVDELVAVTEILRELDEVAIQLHALLTRLTTFPVQEAVANAGRPLVTVTDEAEKEEQTDCTAEARAVLVKARKQLS